MMNDSAENEVTVAVPAYGRVAELGELLQSVIEQSVMPFELLICEDCSRERPQIAAMIAKWEDRFSAKGCKLSYVENEENLGYDGNVRRLFERACGDWVLLLGNDDALLPNCVDAVVAYIRQNPQTRCASRTFVRFVRSPADVIGESRVFDTDTLVSLESHGAGYVFRLCGFVGGLLFKRSWALSVSTTEFDGSLYYQMYLAAQAYCQGGIGYIATPIVAGRAGNPPLFGAAAKERGAHVPGGYTVEGRTRMWQSVLDIFDKVGKEYGLDLVPDVRRELAGRQSFHIFEMLAGKERARTREMRCALISMGLYSGVMPRLLFATNQILGRFAPIFYRLTRRIVQ